MVLGHEDDEITVQTDVEDKSNKDDDSDESSDDSDDA